MKKILAVMLIALMGVGQIFAQEGNTAKIIIFRPVSSSGWENRMAIHTIFFDGQRLCNFPERIYVEVIVDPGQHTIDGYIGPGSPDELKRAGVAYTLKIDVMEGHTYYASIDSKKKKVNLVSDRDYKKSLNNKYLPLLWAAKLELKDDILYANGAPVAGENAHKAKEQLDQNNGSSQPSSTPQKKERILADVDQNIPVTNIKNSDTYVLIIANEEYKNERHVEFAENDGATFKEYCIKTLGIPADNIEFKPNATIGDIYDAVDWLENVLNYIDGSKAIVFYSGHGINDEKTGDAYLIPVDGQAKIMATCFSLNTLYSRLSSTKSANVTYFMDACFTGAGKDGAMLVAARGVAREAKKETLSGNTVVFSATNSDQTAMPYTEKQHGLFTYFLLKKLQESQGNVSYKELQEYLNANVNKYAVLVNRKPQTPTVATSPSIMGSWGNMKLK